MKFASVLFVLGMAVNTINIKADSKNCFELPLVVITPTERRFPENTCTQKRPPAPDCRREPVPAIIEVYDKKVNKIGDQPNCLYDEPSYVYKSITHYRGQSSLGFKKHQMAVNLNSSASFLGFPEDTSFILNGPIIDGSFMRNHLAHWLYRGTGRYSPRTRHIVLYISDALDPDDTRPRYRGVYVALEKIGYGPNRVGLAPLTPGCVSDVELSGGWGWQANPLAYGVYSPNLVADRNLLYFGGGMERPVLTYPPGHKLNANMRNFFVDTTKGPLPMLYQYLFDNMTAPNDLEKYIDIGSVVDYMLHTEMSSNSDAYRRSLYFFKDRGEPINAGPVWDFNLAYGMGNNSPAWIYAIFPLWKQLVCNYKIAALLPKRWRELRSTVWSTASIEKFLNDSAAPLIRQFAHCKDGEWTSLNLQCGYVSGPTVANTLYADQLANLRNAVIGRAEWMDQHITSFFKELNGSVCVPAGPLPDYNCAENGTDSGCLTNPEPYIEAVTFPPIRKPYSGGPCTGDAIASENQPNIDYCWFASGEIQYPFCSGYGFCYGGVNATCNCVDGHKPPSCARNDTVVSVAHTTPKSDTPSSENSELDHPSILMGLLLAFVVVGVVALYMYRRMKNKSTRNGEGMNISDGIRSSGYGAADRQ